MKKRVLIPGCFDLVHIGHFNVMKKAKEQGDYLTVAIHKDSNNSKNVDYFYSLEEREMIIRSFNFVDDVVMYESLDELVVDEQDKFDVLCHGPDNKSDTCLRAYKWCNENDKDVVELTRTENISSTKLRKFISENK